MCELDTDWVGTAPVRAWVEWRWLDNASGAADEDEADTTVIDFVSAPLSWVDGVGGGEEDDFSQRTTSRRSIWWWQFICMIVIDRLGRHRTHTSPSRMDVAQQCMWFCR